MTRKEKKAIIAKEADIILAKILVVMSRMEYEKVKSDIQKAIDNPFLFESGCAELEKDKPHLGKKAALMFLDLCEKQDNDPEKIFLFIKKITFCD